MVEYGATPGSSTGGTTPGSNRRSSSGGPASYTQTPTPGERAPFDDDDDDRTLVGTPDGDDDLTLVATPYGSQRTGQGFGALSEPAMSSSPLSSADDENDSAFGDLNQRSGSDSSDSEDDDDTAGDRTFVSTVGDTTMADMTFARMEMNMDDDETSITNIQPIFKKPTKWRFEGETTGAMS